MSARAKKVRYTEYMATIDITSLSLEERLRLLDELWESLSRTPEAIPLTEAQRGELDRRLDDLDREGPVGIPWDEVRGRIGVAPSEAIAAPIFKSPAGLEGVDKRAAPLLRRRRRMGTPILSPVPRLRGGGNPGQLSFRALAKHRSW